MEDVALLCLPDLRAGFVAEAGTSEPVPFSEKSLINEVKGAGFSWRAALGLFSAEKPGVSSAGRAKLRIPLGYPGFAGAAGSPAWLRRRRSSGTEERWESCAGLMPCAVAVVGCGRGTVTAGTWGWWYSAC